MRAGPAAIIASRCGCTRLTLSAQPPLIPADTVASPLFICILPSAPAVTEVSPLFTVTEPSETETLGVSDAEADADEELEHYWSYWRRMH